MSSEITMKSLEFQLKPKPGLAVLVVFLALWFCPPPQGLTLQAWHVFVTFVCTILGFLTKPLPLGAIVMLALTVLAGTRTLTVPQTLSGFGNHSVWLIVMAFFISRGFAKTGLGRRIGYTFIKLLGNTTLGLAYAIGFTNYCLAPAMPSSTARSGGTVCPLTIAVAKAYGSDPATGTERKIGSYLLFTAFQTNYPVGAAFMTAMAGNTLAASMAADLGVQITWLSWFIAALVPALVSICSVPLALYVFYPPEIKKSPEAREMARQKLAEMGPMSLPEKMMLCAFIILLSLWVFGTMLGVHATIAAFVGIMFLVLVGVLTWKDVLSERGAYDCLIWFAGLIMMASYLNKLGVIKWITGGMSGMLARGHFRPGHELHVSGVLLCQLHGHGERRLRGLPDHRPCQRRTAGTGRHDHRHLHQPASLPHLLQRRLRAHLLLHGLHPLGRLAAGRLLGLAGPHRGLVRRRRHLVEDHRPVLAILNLTVSRG